MASLEELIRNNEIEFYSYGRKLDTKVDDFGEYNWDLIHHITEKAGNRIIITGPGVYQHLKDPENLYSFTDFLNQVWYSGTTKHYSEGISLHVDVDIDALSFHYIQPVSEPIVNGLGQQVCDSKDWVPEMSCFEKMWNLPCATRLVAWWVTLAMSPDNRQGIPLSHRYPLPELYDRHKGPASALQEILKAVP